MHTAASFSQDSSLGFNAISASVPNGRQRPESFNSVSPLSGAENSGASIRSKRSPIQVEPRQGINQSWEDFQREHFEWRHGRAPANASEIPPDEGKLPSPSGWQAVWAWISGLLAGGPGMPEDGIRFPGFRPGRIRQITFRSEEVEPLLHEGGASTTKVKELRPTEAGPSRSTARDPQTPSRPSQPEQFQLKNLDTQRFTSRFNIYYQPGKPQEFVRIDGRWYATAEEKGQRFVYQPGEDGLAWTWPLREDKGEWRFTPLDEMPGRSIGSVERIPSGYRIDAPVGLQEADAQGVYRAGAEEYIKIDGLLYRSGQNADGRFIHDGNLLHPIAVERSGQGWALASPSRGSSGAVRTPTETVKEVFDMTSAQAQTFLSRYQFDAEGPYTERNFARELSETFQIPGWAQRFRVEAGPSRSPAIADKASQPAPPDGMDVINPISGQPIHINEGGYLNSAGFIERTDMPQLYRAIDSVTAGRSDPAKVGFRKSYRFYAVPKMIRGPGVIASASRHGPDLIFGEGNWLDHYAIYSFNAKGLKTVSLQENIRSNPAVMESVFNLAPGVLSEVNAIPDVELRTHVLDDLTWRAYSANEVHVENEGLKPSRITLEEGSTTYDVSSPQGMPSVDSAKTWSPPTSSPSGSPESAQVSWRN
jgi:hypothetical protein